MTIEENIEIQKKISDINVPISEAVRLLVEKCEMTEARARQRVLIARGFLGGDDQVRSGRAADVANSGYCEILAEHWRADSNRTPWEIVAPVSQVGKKVESLSYTASKYEDLALAA